MTTTDEQEAAEEKKPDGNPLRELNRLLELATKYPEIGPPLAELGFKLGQTEFGHRVVRMGLEREAPGIEYAFVAAHAARHEGRHTDAIRYTLDAVKAFARATETLAPDDGQRLLHLIRFAFSTLLFDLRDVQGAPELIAGLAELLPSLEGRLGRDPLYHTLLAQVLWYGDKEKSEAAWDKAAALGDETGEPELTWNARGTWYKDAERDAARAEEAYRKGLRAAPKSALLHHNVAQLLLERAQADDVDPEKLRELVREIDDLLRNALREDAPKGLRRHIHATKDRLHSLRSSLPPRPRAERVERVEEEVKPPAAGDVVTGRVQSLAPYGAFVQIGPRLVGLLHVSEQEPGATYAVGDEVEVKVLEVRPDGNRMRIGLSRRALHAPIAAPPPPAAAAREQQQQRPPAREQQQRPPRKQQQQPAQEKPEKFLAAGRVSLGEMILAKLKESQNK